LPKRIFTWAFILIIFFPGLIRAQEKCELVLTGVIRDSDSKELLSDARIELAGTAFETHTNEQGFFELKGLCKGNYTLIVGHASCAPLVKKLKLEGSLNLNLVLPHRTNSFREVVVQEKGIRFRASVSEELSGKELFEKRGLSLGESLENLNGVRNLQTGPSVFKPMINGLYGNRIVVVNNGSRLESQQWGAEHAPEIDPFTAGKITVLKGASALRYGSDGLGGTLLTEALPMPSGGKRSLGVFQGYQSNRHLLSSNVFWEASSKSLPALSYRIQASTRDAGNVKTPSYYQWNTGSKERNASLQISWRKPEWSMEYQASLFSSTLGIFYGSQVGNLSDLRHAIQASEPLLNINRFSYAIDRPRQEVQHYTQSLHWMRYKDPAHVFHMRLNFQNNRRKEFDLSKISDLPELDLNLTTYLLESWYEHNHDEWTYTYGASSQLQTNAWDGNRFFIPNYRQWQNALFFISKKHLSNSDLEMGLRFDSRYLTSFRNNQGRISSESKTWNNLSASAAWTKQTSSNFRWGLSGNLAWRAPSINELYTNGLHHGTSTFEVGNPNLKSEQGIKSGINFIQTALKQSLQAELFVYGQYIRNFINLVSDSSPVLTIRGAYPSFHYDQTDAFLSGIDAKLAWQSNSFLRFQLMYSSLFARDISRKDWLQQMPSDRWQAEIKAKPFGIGKLKELEIKLGYSLVSKQNRVSSYFIDYKESPASYGLMNVSLGWKNQDWNVQLFSTNLLNTRYREYLNRFRYFTDEPGISIGIRTSYIWNQN